MTTTRRIQIDNYDTAPKWAQALDGTPATAEQIEASDAAEQGLIRLRRDGTPIRPGQYHNGGALRVWVD